METLDYLYDLISKTETSLIGYKFSDERKKDEIISNLGKTKKLEIDSSFSILSSIRNIKIEQVINNLEFEYFLLDINDIIALVSDTNYSTIITNIIYEVRSYLRDNRQGKDVCDIKLIITCPLNSNIINVDKRSIDSFYGGSTPIYYADLVLIIKEDTIQIVKHRVNDNPEYKNIKYDSIK